MAADLPGLGDNLIDRPLAAVDLPTTPGFVGPRLQAILTLRSSLAEPGGPPDLHLFPTGPFDDAASPAGGVFGIVAGLLSVRSRGTVRLRSADPADPPRINVAHLRHPEDMTRMIEATRHARQLSRTPPLAGFVTGAELVPGPAISDDDIAGLAASILNRASSYHHPVGTCAMGPDPDDGAVADARGKVDEIDGLWVADRAISTDKSAWDDALPAPDRCAELDDPSSAAQGHRAAVNNKYSAICAGCLGRPPAGVLTLCSRHFWVGEGSLSAKFRLDFCSRHLRVLEVTRLPR